MTDAPESTNTAEHRLDAVIFDLDGVLLDSEIHWKRVGPEFLAAIVPGWSTQDQISIHGMSVEQVYQHLCERYELRISREQLHEHYRLLAAQIYGVQSQVLPGALELMRALKRDQVRLGLATSAPTVWARIALDRFGLEREIEAVVTSDDADFEIKPSPAIYRIALQKLGVAARNALAVEDTDRGIASARAAGLSCIGFRNGFNDRQQFSDATFVTSDLHSLGRLALERILRSSNECSGR